MLSHFKALSFKRDHTELDDTVKLIGANDDYKTRTGRVNILRALYRVIHHDAYVTRTLDVDSYNALSTPGARDQRLLEHWPQLHTLAHAAYLPAEDWRAYTRPNLRQALNHTDGSFTMSERAIAEYWLTSLDQISPYAALVLVYWFVYYNYELPAGDEALLDTVLDEYSKNCLTTDLPNEVSLDVFDVVVVSAKCKTDVTDALRRLVNITFAQGL